MSDTTIYLTDSDGVYIGPKTISIYAAVPDGAQFVPPPVVSAPAVARWSGVAWDVLPDQPVSIMSIASRVEAALHRIDTDVDAIYRAVIGDRAAEYQAAEREALSYISAAYSGDPPPMVAGWAAAKGWSGEAAADDIAAQATRWRAAMSDIRATRLMIKEGLRQATGQDEVSSLISQWESFVVEMRQALGAA